MRSFSRKLKISISLNQQFYFSNLFVANRTQCVKVGIELSDKININHGVLQGTVLGPLIFLLYVNDFSEKLEGENDVVQFADDTSVVCKFERNEYLKENQIPYREPTHFNCRENRCYSLQIILIRIQRFLLKAKLSNQFLHVIWEYKLIQS